MKTTLFALYFLFSVLSFAQDTENDMDTPPTDPPSIPRLPRQWIDRLNDTVYDEWEDAGTKLSASIFESLTNRELFKKTIAGDLSLSLRVQRRVFNNQDILDTYTVVDFLKAPLYLPIPLYADEIGFGAGGIGLNIGLSFGADSFHIRQVAPENIEQLRSLEDIEKDLTKAGDEADSLYHELKTKNWDYTVIREDDSDDSYFSRFLFWKTQDPKIRARYNKLWNLVTHPLKIPLSAKRMDEMPVGEITSYGLNGGVQLGLRAGWSQFEIAGLDLTATQASLGITTYLRGNFDISLWKESENHAQIKLTRSFTKGTNYNIGHLSLQQELFEGFMVLDRTLLKIKEEFIPFSFNVNKSTLEELAIGYRYDLTKEKAREAYNLATMGRLKLSYDYAQDPESGVEERFLKTSQTQSENESYRMKLSLLFEKSSGNSLSQTKATVHMDGVEHKLFTSKSLIFKSYDSLWGASESRRHEFFTTLNENTYQSSEADGLGMRIIGRIEDSHTDGEELHDYILEVEAAIQKPGTFPRPPVYLPEVDCDTLSLLHSRDYRGHACQSEGDTLKRKAEYGRTSFYYQVDLDLNHLVKIQEASEKEYWLAMEKAFEQKEGSWSRTYRRILSLGLHSYATILNIPLALFNINLSQGGRLIIAYKFFRQWKKLKGIKDPRELVRAFGKLYDTVHYGSELVKATRILAGNAQANFSMTASAPDVWGKMSGSHGSLGNVFPIGDEAERRSNFDRVGPRINVDPEAKINSLSLKEVDKDTVKLSFDLTKKPKFLYLRIDRTSSWSAYNSLLKIVINNNGQIKKGLNEVYIKRSDRVGLAGKLRKAIFNGKNSHLMLAYSLNNQDFGAVSSYEFRFDEDEDEDEKNKAELSLDEAKSENRINDLKQAL